MATTLTNLNTLVNDRRRDTSDDSIDMTADGFRAVVGALQIWDQTHDWPWQIETQTIQYNPGIDTYKIPASWAYKAMVDVRPQKQPNNSQEFYFVSNNKFDSDNIHTYKFAVKNDAQGKYLRLDYTGYTQVINTLNSVAENGTWVGASAISNVAKDAYESFSQTASLKFDYSGTSGTLTNSTMTTMDLSRYAQRSSIYFDIYLADVADFTSVTVKVGSSASDYITQAISTDYLGNSLKTGWNRLKMTWDGSTTVVGTLDAADITYAQFTITYSSNPSTVSNRIENLFVSENIPVTIEYYSHFMAYDDGTSSKVQTFIDGADAGNDYPLWSGEWDFVNEAFVNSVLEIIFFMTGEYDDRDRSIQRIQSFVEPLKSRLPSKRRYPEMQIVPDLN